MSRQKLPVGQTRIKTDLTLPQTLLAELEQYCQLNKTKKSVVLEKALLMFFSNKIRKI